MEALQNSIENTVDQMFNETDPKTIINLSEKIILRTKRVLKKLGYDKHIQLTENLNNWLNVDNEIEKFNRALVVNGFAIYVEGLEKLDLNVMLKSIKNFDKVLNTLKGYKSLILSIFTTKSEKYKQLNDPLFVVAIFEDFVGEEFNFNIYQKKVDQIQKAKLQSLMRKLQKMNLSESDIDELMQIMNTQIPVNIK